MSTSSGEELEQRFSEEGGPCFSFFSSEVDRLSAEKRERQARLELEQRNANQVGPGESVGAARQRHDAAVAEAGERLGQTEEQLAQAQQYLLAVSEGRMPSEAVPYLTRHLQESGQRSARLADELLDMEQIDDGREYQRWAKVVHDVRSLVESSEDFLNDKRAREKALKAVERGMAETPFGRKKARLEEEARRQDLVHRALDALTKK